MAKPKHSEQKPRNAAERKLWLYFMAFRGGCAIAALVAALNLSIGDGIMVAVILLFILGGVESAYKSTVYWLRKREQKEAERLRRQQAEAEYRERQRRFKAAQDEASEKYFDSSMMTLGQSKVGEAG